MNVRWLARDEEVGFLAVFSKNWFVILWLVPMSDLRLNCVG
jgi:hypothetical protein